MDIKIAALRSLQTITFLAFVVLAGLYYMRGKEFFSTFLILVFAIVYLVFQIIIHFNLNPEEKNRLIVGLSSFFWIYIIDFLLEDTPYRNIRIYLIWIPFILFLLWLIITGEWRELLEPISRFLKFINLTLEYYLLKRYRD